MYGFIVMSPTVNYMQCYIIADRMSFLGSLQLVCDNINSGHHFYDNFCVCVHVFKTLPVNWTLCHAVFVFLHSTSAARRLVLHRNLFNTNK